MVEYRNRIYKNYVYSRSRSLAPASIEGLMSRAAMFRKIIRLYFPGNVEASILDLGCGHGAFVHFIREAGYNNVTGVDCSPEQVAEAVRLGIVGVREGDLIETLQGLPEASMDIVIAFDVIEHFHKEELLPFIDNVWRVLRPGGRFIIHAPNGESPFAGRIRYGDFTHEQAFTRVSIAQILLSSGFSKVHYSEDAPIPKSFISFIRWIFWKMIRAGWRFYLAVETGAGERECIFTQNFLTVASK